MQHDSIFIKNMEQASSVHRIECRGIFQLKMVKQVVSYGQISSLLFISIFEFFQGTCSIYIIKKEIKKPKNVTDFWI